MSCISANTKFDYLLQNRPSAHKPLLSLVLQILDDSSHVKALFLHGSITRGGGDEYSDMDLIALVESQHVLEVDHQLTDAIEALNTPAYDSVTKDYPWFGRLRCLQWTTPNLQVDLGVVHPESLADFFVEPCAIIIRDWEGRIAAKRIASENQRRAACKGRIRESEARVFAALRKIHKSLARGRLWNAIAGVAQLRRIFFGLVVLERDPHAYLRVGREDRDIESIVSDELMDRLAPSAANYSVSSVVTATSCIVSALVELDSVKASWCSQSPIHGLVQEISRLGNMTPSNA